jgi:hypothetical protein
MQGVTQDMYIGILPVDQFTIEPDGTRAVVERHHGHFVTPVAVVLLIHKRTYFRHERTIPLENRECLFDYVVWPLHPDIIM